VSCRGAPTERPLAERSPAVPERKKRGARRGYSETNAPRASRLRACRRGRAARHAPGPEEQIRSGPSSLPDGRQDRRFAQKIQLRRKMPNGIKIFSVSDQKIKTGTLIFHMAQKVDFCLT